MNAKTTLVLLTLLALLAGAIWWQTDREQDELDLQRRLFAGVDVERVVALRVDNIERAYNLRLERDEAGRWFMTDPLAYPAAPEQVTLLLEDVAGALAIRTPAEERGATELGFDPPRAVVSVEERLADGARRVTRVEVGAPDPDRMRVNVRADGEYYRSLVRLYTTINKRLEDFRAQRVLALDPRSVVEVTRAGVMLLELGEEPVDTELVAYLDGFQWRALRPVEALLDPLDLGIVIVGAARARVANFVEDQPVDLKRYFLDPPGMRLELKTADGETETLLMGRRGSRPPWYLMREGFPHVWSIDDEDAERLMFPAREMYDRRFMRVLREDVDALLLDADGRRLELRRGARGWSARRTPEGGAPSAPLAADAAVVDDALARLEDLELALLPPGAAPGFAPLATLAVEVGGVRLGGSVGLRADGAGAQDTLLFRREGDELLLVAEPWLLELARRPLEAFRSKQLVDLGENELSGLRLAGADGARAFVRDGQGLWHPAGEEREAVALLPLLDALVYLKAEAFLAADAELEGAVTVRFERFEGEPLELEVGTVDGRSAARVAGEVSALKVADLHERLLALLQG